MEDIIYHLNTITKIEREYIENFHYTYLVDYKKTKDLLKIEPTLSPKDLISIIENSINDKIFVVWAGKIKVDEGGEEYLDVWDFKFYATEKDCLSWIDEDVATEKEGVGVLEVEKKIVINKINEV